jgi:hypothetical protein
MAVVNTVNWKIVRTRPEFPNETLQPSWDLIQAICAVSRIDWNNHAQAIRHFHTTSNIFMVKLLS